MTASIHLPDPADLREMCDEDVAAGLAGYAQRLNDAARQLNRVAAGLGDKAVTVKVSGHVVTLAGEVVEKLLRAKVVSKAE